jgi:hypothetical protein
MTAPSFVMPDFGQDADTYVAPVFDPDDIWIKNFQEGTHRVRLLQEPGKFVTYRQHYDAGIKKTFPCTEDTQTCLGCTSDAERTRKRPRQYAFNALDAEGNLGLYRVGVGVKEDMESEIADRVSEGKSASLLGVDVIIKRTGKTMDDTKYRVKLGEEYPVEFTEDLYNIKKVLADHYLQALEAAGVDVEALLAESSEPEHDEPVAPKKAAAKTKAKSDKPGYELPEGSPEDWTLTQLKDYLTQADVEFNERAGRAVLEPIVTQHVKENLPF